MAPAAQGFSAMEHGLWLFPAFLAGRDMASDLDDPVDAGARTDWQGSVTDRGCCR